MKQLKQQLAGILFCAARWIDADDCGYLEMVNSPLVKRWMGSKLFV